MVPLKEIEFVRGKLSSSPVKLSNNDCYICNLSAISVGKSYGQNKVTSSAKGNLDLLVSSDCIDDDSALFLEQGQELKCNVFWNDKRNAFQARSIENMGFSNSAVGKLNSIRAFCRISLKKILQSWGKAGGLVISLITGSRDYLAKDVEKLFRNAGLSHILALSGMHISFFASLTGKLCAKTIGKKYVLLARFIGIMLFIWLAGFSPSLYRAFLFSSIIIVLLYKDCRIDNYTLINVLSFVFLIHIIAKTKDMESVAFMLSYSALYGILIGADIFFKYAIRILPPYIANSISVSTSAQIATSPICLMIFGKISPIGIIATLFVSPLIAIFLSISFFGIIITCLIPFLSPVFSCILNLLYMILMIFVRFFARG